MKEKKKKKVKRRVDEEKKCYRATCRNDHGGKEVAKWQKQKRKRKRKKGKLPKV